MYLVRHQCKGLEAQGLVENANEAVVHCGMRGIDALFRHCDVSSFAEGALGRGRRMTFGWLSPSHCFIGTAIGASANGQEKCPKGSPAA